MFKTLRTFTLTSNKKFFSKSSTYDNFHFANSKVFTEEKLKTAIGPKFYAEFKDAQKTGKKLGKQTEDAIAEAMKSWALSHRCITFAHWFSPLRGYNAEKYDSLIQRNDAGEIISGFSASQLFTGETDGSSFPTGGMRNTHEAAGFTSWDTSSPPFILNDCLFIPSAFIAWSGEALDHKTPLLRSSKIINEQSVRLLRLLGDKTTTDVFSNVGWEQEFFVIDKNNFLKRPDLLATGRTLIGHLPSLGQQTEKHYFGKMPQRVREYLRDVQHALWKRGIAQFTVHNEVSPSQYEICPIYTRSTVGADHNTLAMELLESYAHKHNLICLLHEKPFSGINGSGKHNNWSLTTNNGDQLFSPGKTKFEQERFITFLACVSRALRYHGDLIRIGVAVAGNDHRLGLQEAPPAIISLYTGTILESHLKDIIDNDGPLDGYGKKSENLNFGTPTVLEMNKNIEDRNRTASFPLCTNRFEFRAVGSSQNISWPLTIINATVADSISNMCEKLEKGKSLKESVKEMLKENINVVFNGNGYSSEWMEEAKRRKLWNLPQTIDALEQIDSEKNEKLFISTKIFSKHELESRKEILLENYVKTMLIEVDCLIKMVNKDLLPVCIQDLKNIENSSSKLAQKSFKEKEALYSSLEEETSKLISMYGENYPKHEDLLNQGKFISHDMKSQMAKIREICDKIEEVLPRNLYPYPDYEKILYDHHY